MTDTWLVLKFGGTSVCSARQWKSIALLAQQRLDDGYRTVLVCSAMQGVTDALQFLAQNTGNRDTGKVKDKVKIILERHLDLSSQLGVDAQDLVHFASGEIKRLLRLMVAAADSAARYSAMASLLTMGEWLSTKIGERYLDRSLAVEWVDAREALQAIPESDKTGRRSRLSARCESGSDQTLIRKWLQKKSLLITQGFVAAHPCGGDALLGRGGSDTSAAVIAGRLQAEQVEIWTDIPGLFSADPRWIPAARLLNRLSYDEALEMAASGAKVVHSRCIRAAADANIPLQVRDLGNVEFSGTRIGCAATGTGSHAEGVRAVCCQSQMAVLLLQNLDTREHVGFLAWVFLQISEAGISVDLVATSETTTTVAINKVSNQLDNSILEQLAQDLRARCIVTVYPHCSSVNLVGRGSRVALADIDTISGFFIEHPLLMLSSSANDLCISMLVHSQHANELLKVLHKALIENGTGRGGRNEVFGPRWKEIQSST